MKFKHVILGIITSMLLISCSNESSSSATNSSSSSSTTSSHTHTFDSTWENDGTYHWHKSTCGHDVVDGKAKHAFKDEVINPTYDAGGYTTHTCTVCNYSFKDNETDKLIHKYTITWKNYDGSILDIDSDVEEGTLPTYDGVTPQKPNDDNYTYSFDGWNPEVKVATSDQTYTAKFSSSKITYTINFDLNGGTSSSYQGSQVVEAFTKDVFFFDCVKEGLNFRGWSYNGTKIFDEKGNQLANPKMVSTMTFVAEYANTAKLTITSNMPGAGTITGQGEYSYNTYVDVSAHPIIGYKFVGWYYQGNLLSNTEDYKYMMWDQDVTLEARFKLDTFTLNIKSNNSTYGLVLLKSTKYNQYEPSYTENIDYTTQTTIAAYSQSDVRFLGWYGEENKLVSTNAVYTFTMPNYDYNLEAKWNYFTISYNLNGGTQNDSNPTSYTMDDGSLTLYKPTKDGYTFLGWKFKGEFVSSVNPNWIDNITLDAVWEATTYSITYHLDGGTNPSSNPMSYDIEDDNITLDAPSKTGYTFDGWYSDSAFNNKMASITSGSYGDVNLYAKWSVITYSISYNLNGGTNSSSNPSSYTVEDTITLVSASKTGYIFQGWYDGSDQVTTISKGTVGNISLTATWNEGNEYVVTLDPNGGTLSETSVNVQYDHSYSLPTPSRNGYTFVGWYIGSTCVSNSGAWKYASNQTLKASWNIIKYSIKYNLDGGTNSSSNPSSYTIESQFVFNEPSKTGYSFDGWYNEESKITSIEKGTTGNLTLDAKWSANKNNLSVISEDETKGTVSITSGVGYSDETITVTATPIGDWVFKGWFNGSDKVSNEETYSFTMPTNDYSLVAHFYTKAEAEEEEERNKKLGIIPVIDETNNTLTYGLYPQSHVNDADTIVALNALTTADSNGWYLYNDEYYAKKSANPYNSGYTFNDGTTINSGTTYWFKCEPIEWKILTSSDGSYSLVSTVLLDAHRYDSSYNNYKNSEIRSWLNDDFLNTAFNLDSSLIQTTTVDNSAFTTGSSSNSYACANTEDKIYLLSYKDYLNTDYGFSTSTSSSTTRTCKPTDYALANYCYQYDGNGFNWTRSPYSDFSGSAWYVSIDGTLDYSSRVDYANDGVRPAITIKL